MEYLVDAHKHTEVVQIRLKDLSGTVEMEGILLKNDWILTAAHGLNAVEVNSPIYIQDSLYHVSKIHIHPDFEGFENDIALIQIDKQRTVINPVNLFQRTDELGKKITILGRGGSGTGLTGPLKYDSKLRMASNIIDSVTTHWIKFRFDEPDHPNTTEFEGISGPGDSGGPAFIELDGIKYLAGISSNQQNRNLGIKEGHYGVVEYYTRISTYYDWIYSIIENGYDTHNHASFQTIDWGFPDSEIGRKASLLMNAISSKEITDDLMEAIFFHSFRESFDLKNFISRIAQSLNEPRIGEIRRARNHVLIFTIQSDNNTYLMQIEADRRDDYLIGGLIFKKAE